MFHTSLDELLKTQAALPKCFAPVCRVYCVWGAGGGGAPVCVCVYVCVCVCVCPVLSMCVICICISCIL